MCDDVSSTISDYRFWGWMSTYLGLYCFSSFLLTHSNKSFDFPKMKLLEYAINHCRPGWKYVLMFKKLIIGHISSGHCVVYLYCIYLLWKGAAFDTFFIAKSWILVSSIFLLYVVLFAETAIPPGSSILYFRKKWKEWTSCLEKLMDLILFWFHPLAPPPTNFNPMCSWLFS